MATLYSGSKNITIEYDSKDPVATREAWIQFLGCTEEEYDARQEDFRKDMEETYNKYPNLKGLIWANDEMYYVDSEGNRTDKEVNFENVCTEIRDSFTELTKGMSETIAIHAIDENTTIEDIRNGDLSVLKEGYRMDFLNEELAKVKK